MLVTHTVTINAPPADVFGAYLDVERWPEWTATVRTVDRLEPGPIRVGARTRIRQPKLREAVWEVTEFDPGLSFTWVSRMPGLVSTARHVVAGDGDGSTVTLSVEHSGILGPLVGVFTKRLTQRYLAVEGGVEAPVRRVIASLRRSG
jgi:uncharacterized protein YndB with AHSA1/START domain